MENELQWMQVKSIKGVSHVKSMRFLRSGNQGWQGKSEVLLNGLPKQGDWIVAPEQACPSYLPELRQGVSLSSFFGHTRKEMLLQGLFGRLYQRAWAPGQKSDPKGLPELRKGIYLSDLLAEKEKWQSRNVLFPSVLE